MSSRILIFVMLLSLVKAASKYYDGPIRPYEFGFNIEGHHHRKESKDINGIIMGEFGFVTADNVYHVTVYATDEDGNFKIVSMKNYKLGPVMPPTASTPKATTTTSTTPQPFRIITTAKPPSSSRPSGVAPACSGCRIPETTTAAKQQTTDSSLPETSTQYVPPFKIVNKNEIESITTTVAPKSSATVTTTAAGGSSKETPQKLVEKQQNSKESTNGVKPPNAMQPSSKQSQTPTSAEKTAQKSGQPSKTSSSTSTTGSTGSKLDHTEAAKMMIQHILNGLLYRFNYTVGYHGHHEEGDRAGNKEGGYFAVGRDGVRRGVTYTANEFGFQPHIKFDRVSPEETPREETEKQAGLKGFDFKWFWGEAR